MDRTFRPFKKVQGSSEGEKRYKAPFPGTVILYENADWDGRRTMINTGELIEGVRHSIEDLGLNHNKIATWVAYNLPVGIVLTLCENASYQPADKPVYDLRDCGRCVDLIGTGKPERLDLGEVNMNDCVSMLFWRRVNVQAGALELFDDADFGGCRNVLFLSEWEARKWHSIEGWWLGDRVTSVRWLMLHPLQTVGLAEHPDGSGRRYENIRAWQTEGTNSNLRDFNDMMSSFRWDAVMPVKDEVDPVVVEFIPEINSSAELLITEHGINHTTVNQDTTVTFRNENTETITLELSTEALFSVGLDTEIAWAAKAWGFTEGSVKCTVRLRFDYKLGAKRTTSVAHRQGISVAQKASAPPLSSWQCTARVQVGRMAPIVRTTKVRRWYQYPVDGATEEAGTGLYVRDETATFILSGNLATDVEVEMNSAPL